MKNLRRAFISAAAAGLLAALPLTVQAAAVLQSQNFQVQGVNFGSNITLLTTVDQQPPSISSDGPTVTGLKPTQVTITWLTDKESSSTVYYGPTASYGLQNGSTDLVTTHTVTLYGLTPETLYHFKVSSTGLEGASGQSDDHSLTTPADTGITSIEISNIGYNNALVSWQTGNVTSSTLDYGTTTAYGKSQSDKSTSLTTDHTLQLQNLIPGTPYHIRISATDSQGNVSQSSDFGFSTLPDPSFTSLSFVNDSPNEVAIHWNTNVPTTGIVKVVQKGQTTGQSLGEGDLLIQHVTVVQNLNGLTTYEASIMATDAQGHQVTSATQEFTTIKDTVAPVISGLAVNVTQSDSALVMAANWQTNKLANTQAVLVAKSGPSATFNLPGQSGLTIDHIVAKAGLLPATPYSLTVSSTDAAGNVGTSVISFITPAVHKSILQLLLDSLTNAFGWTGKIGK